jgi:murein tripeptide amidase MpaA
MRIDADIDGGSIEVLDQSEPSRARLALRRDTNAEFLQWFHFRVSDAKGTACELVIENASEATFPDAFEGYRACASYDGDDWFRVPTSWDGTKLVISHTPEQDVVLYAYFAPYTFERHERLLARASEKARVEVLGESVEGRPMSMIVFDRGRDDEDEEEEDDRRIIWINARQHPGETMAEWFAEGVIERLLDDDDETTNELLSRAIVHVIPNMCPDGGVLGNLRANAAGVNLNRSWQEPSEEESPEVFCVRQRMMETGVDLFLDIHGDERTPYCFAAGCEGNPSYDDRMDALEDLFMESLIAFDPDFQRQFGYENDKPGEGDLTTAGNWVGEELGCLSLTIEMPFKDNANAPDEARGWSPERSKALGAASLNSVLVCLDTLR